MAAVFPLLGAEKERVWSPGWEPRFVWPPLAADQEGMVFRVSRGEWVATWVNTAFDPSTGRIQYVYVIPDVLVTVITLQLHPRADATEVVVRYERTSLSVESDALVAQMAAQDRDEGPVWARQVNTHLAAPMSR